MTGFTRSKTVGAFLGRYHAIYKHLPAIAQTKHVSIEDLLFRWGVQCQQIGSKRKSAFSGLYQRFIVLLTAAVYLRAIILSLRPTLEKRNMKNEAFWNLFGDFFYRYASTNALNFYNSANLFIAQYVFFIAFFCYRKRKQHSRWHWVRFFALFQHKVSPGEYEETAVHSWAALFWYC